MTLHKGIYEQLKEVARNGELITYGEIAPLAKLNMESPGDRNRIGEILGEISTFEHENHRPMLFVLVVHADDGMPGDGFFNLARELGLLHGSDDEKELAFFAGEVAKVHAYWSDKG